MSLRRTRNQWQRLSSNVGKPVSLQPNKSRSLTQQTMTSPHLSELFTLLFAKLHQYPIEFFTQFHEYFNMPNIHDFLQILKPKVTNFQTMVIHTLKHTTEHISLLVGRPTFMHTQTHTITLTHKHTHTRTRSACTLSW